MKLTTYLPLLAGLCLATPARAQLAPTTEEALDTVDYERAYRAYMDSIQAELVFLRDTTVVLGPDMADLAIPDGYSYIGSADAQKVLTEMWGNPPDFGEDNYGMLFNDEHPPSDPAGYGVVLTYVEDGYVDDADAADMDYDDLLETMQEDTDAANAEREEAGYGAIELVGWAKDPHYDAVNQRLHWAKDLVFDGAEEHTLNYNILFLGRRGYLMMNVIGSMEDLPEVNADLNDFLGSVAYQDGHRYADFDADIDEVAAYGVGALIAGKVLAKTGLLAGIGIFLAKAWKIILVALVAVGGGFRKLFGGK